MNINDLGTVTCRECDQKHVAEFDHIAQFGGARVFSVICPKDQLTDYYTEDVVTVGDASDPLVRFYL